MSMGFYEILGASRGSNASELERAVSLRLDGLRRRLDGAAQRGDPDVAIRAEIGKVREAWSVLSDPSRRASYDRFAALGEDLPFTAQELAKEVFATGMDAPTRTAAALVGSLTTLKVNSPTAVTAPSTSYAATPQPARHTTPGVHPHAVAVDTTLSHEFETTAPGEKEARKSVSEQRPSQIAEHTINDMVGRLGFSGALLQQVRKGRGLSLEQIAAKTHISLPYLQALEAEDLSKLPARTFVRGYLKSVCGVLGLDEDALVNGYLVRIAARRRGG